MTVSRSFRIPAKMAAWLDKDHEIHGRKLSRLAAAAFLSLAGADPIERARLIAVAGDVESEAIEFDSLIHPSWRLPK